MTAILVEMVLVSGNVGGSKLLSGDVKKLWFCVISQSDGVPMIFWPKVIAMSLSSPDLKSCL